MKLKKILSVGITCTMMMSLIAGCGATGGSGSSGAATESATESATTAATTAAGGSYTPGKYTGSAEGKNGTVTVEVELTEDSIKSVTVTEHQETEGISDPAIEEIPKAIVAAQSFNVDAISGATITSDAIKEAVKAAIESSGADTSAASAGGESAPVENKDVTFTAGTYTGKANGYNGPVELDVTFTDSAIDKIEVKTSKETAHIGDIAYDLMFADAKEATGSGVDAISGATFTSAAVRAALNDAAEQAGCSDLDAFKKNTVKHEAGEKVTGEYDVIVVGAGGAGMAAAAQAAQNGDKVLVIEENAEIGGNTLASGGQYQSVMPYLVWDEKDPDATKGKYERTGEEYDKVTNQAKGNLDILRTISEWSEDEFNEKYFDDHEYVAGDIEDLSKAGVHKDYLPILKTLKSQIKPYLEWADKKIKAGANEEDLTLFSTLELHEFQTYYGGLRQSSDGKQWIYGDVDLVKQVVEDGQGLKEWLEDQGALFDESKQLTLIGALWYRENMQLGADLDGDGKVDDGTSGNWGAYFVPVKKTVEDKGGEIMLRTTAKELISDGSRVTGVKAVKYDGTEVEVTAKKGVVIATGGYANNIDMVQQTNLYWEPSYINDKTESTNRGSLMGDGIKMGEAVDAAVTGEGWTQMMPISWVDNGDLAFGSGAPCIYINPKTGKRFVNETSERDVLSLGEFRNGAEVNGTQGVFLEISNAESAIWPYAYATRDADGNVVFNNDDVEMRQYVRTVDKLDDLFKELGWVETDAATVKAEIEEYDKAFLDDTMSKLAVPKTGASTLIGTAEKDSKGKYDASTYKLDDVPLRIRVMAPSTHHTMGGLKIDTERHVLKEDGSVITGLYAAGEVTGGIHGGNRLGGNAIVEIYVSGRTAANSIDADNK